jgi:hypothetical protein
MIDWTADERRAGAALRLNAALIDSGETARRDPRPAPRGAPRQGRLLDPERFCARGHELTPDNTYYRRSGEAACRRCLIGA